MRKIKILHTADMQYKDRDQSKSINSYIKTSREIEKIISEKEIDIYLFAGDILEYDNPTDAERNLMYQHFGRVLSINTLKEFVVMNGNHDIKLGKNIELSQIGNNPLNTFVESIKYINPDYHQKLTYLKSQKNYKSKVSDKLGFVSYSLEDGKSTGNNLINNIIPAEIQNQYTIPVFHDILYQYAIETKLPLSQSKLIHLMRLENFICKPEQDTLVLAGDIHENWETKFESEETGKIRFVYPGSPVQRNHGEGTYCYISPNGFKFKPADVKVVKYIELFLDEENPDNTYYTITDIPLENTLSYIKFDFNSKFVEDWKSQLLIHLQNLSDSGRLSNLQNLIKIELSNVYMNFENEIITIISDYFNEHILNFNIEVVYGQVFFEASEEQLNIQKILKENSNISESEEESETDITYKETYDFNSSEEIALNQEQLKLVFNSLLDSLSNHIRKEFTTETEYQEVIKELESLFAQQLDLSYGSKRSYNIELLNVMTNGFMSLGENEINLDIPGLTRIIGNNGIGKTTLYNMLRWVIKGVVLENLPKNTKKENLLLIFNDKLPEQNTVKVELALRVNGTKVLILRTAHRTWKKSATDKDKTSLQWRNFIESASSSVLVKIYKDIDNPIEYKDNEAQLNIDTWFGNTIENIFIINQFKLMSLLNQNGDLLKETILNYIGVDYLQALQNNLESIKNQYTINKPAKSQADIVTERTNIQKDLESFDERIETVQTESNKQSILLEETKTKLDSVIKELMEIGNVPNRKETLENTISDLKNDIINFEPKTKKALPTFDKVKPLLNQEQKDVYTFRINDFTKRLETINQQIDDYGNEFSEKKKLTLSKLEEKINQSRIEYCNKLEELSNSVNSTIVNHKNIIHNTISDLDKEFRKRMDNMIVKINNNISETKLKKDKLDSDIFKLDDNIFTLEQKISSGICQTCKRPMDISDELLSEWKKELEATNLEKVVKEKERETFRATILELEKKLLEQEKYRTGVENKLQSILLMKSDEIMVIEGEHEFIFNNQHMIKLLELWDKKNMLNESYSILIQTLEAKSLLESEERLVSIKKDIKKFEDLYTEVKSLTLSLFNENEHIETKNANIKRMLEIKSLQYDLIKSQNSLNGDLLNTKDKLYDLERQYQQELESYNTALEEYQSEVERINKYNDSVEDHNKGIKQTELTLNVKQKEYDDLINSDLLEKYDKLKRCKEQYEISIEESQNTINEYAKKKMDLEHIKSTSDEKLKALEELVNAWVEYRKKTFIYKTFERLIKDDFKQAIFNYYRNYLNNKLNILLDGLNFRLFWNSDSNLYMVEVEASSGEMIYRPVKLSSGMQTAFLGLSLIYCFHLLNIRNSISHIFIDEISGQLNSGKNVKGESNSETKNYQQQLVLLLSKFDKKNVFIIDHVIDNLYETYAYNVRRENGLTKYE